MKLYTTRYTDYLTRTLEIFLVTFVIGSAIDHVFRYLTDTYGQHSQFIKTILALVQLFVIINIAYIWHITTSRNISYEYQIAHPSILMSSLMLNLQDTMFSNFGQVSNELFSIQ